MKPLSFFRNQVSINETRLQFELWIRSVHRLWLVPVLFGCVWLVVHVGVLRSVEAHLPEQQQRLDSTYSDLARLRHPGALVTDDSGWQSLSPLLISPSSEDTSFQSIFRSADLHHVRIVEASYRAVKTPLVEATQTAVVIPVKGSYPDIRTWFDDVMLANPALSLDDITFKREAVGNGQVQAQLRFTLTKRSNPGGSPLKVVSP